ncbi:MAG: hypothetical protein M3R35_08590 [Candidatus Eremiobacteraeota bacterium]|nr:hypothetical protein [Candidatus Eremiobacteraeota bacterium]
MALNPSRPAEAKDLAVAVGAFEGYEFETKPVAMMISSLRSKKTGALQQYLLSANTMLDGADSMRS